MLVPTRLRIDEQGHARGVEPDPRERDRAGDVRVLRICQCRLARAPLKDYRSRRNSIEIRREFSFRPRLSRQVTKRFISTPV
jgi:hypothetical protein